MKPEDVVIHGRVISRRAALLARQAGIPVKGIRVTENETDKTHTVTITVTLDASAVTE